MSEKVNVKKPVLLSHRSRIWMLGILIFLVYGRTINYDFVGLDDGELIVDNFAYISDLSNIPTAFTTHAFYNPAAAGGSNVYYRPILTLSLMLDAQIGGKSPAFYHLINILLHIFASVLLLKLLIRFDISADLSFLFALLFAVHPALSQAVAWIPGRNDSLLAVFVFACFIFLSDHLKSSSLQKLFFHFLFFGLAMFTKESAISMPLIAIVFVVIFGRKEPSAGQKNVFRSIVFLLAGYLVVLLPWYLLRVKVVENTTADLSFSGLSHSFVTNLPMLLQFIQKSLLPFFLSILSVPADTNYLLSIALILLIGFFLFRSKEKNGWTVLLGILWFCAFLLPGFVVHILTGFEHRVYVPLLGIFLVLSEIDALKKFSLNNMKNVLSGVAVVLIFLIATVSHSVSYSGNYFFWKTAATNSAHSALARMNYGLALARNGEVEKAMQIYKEGLSINPQEPLIHNNLGTIYARNNRFAEAEDEFKKEIEVNPTFSDAYFNLGILYQQTGRDSLMLAMWNKALEINPRNMGVKNAIERYNNSKK